MSRKILPATLIILVTGVLLFWIFYPNKASEIYNSFNQKVADFKQTPIGSTVSKISSEILAPIPLNIGGLHQNVVLLQSKIIIETNLARQENGNLPALTENQQLDEAAAAKAADMFKNQYFEHVSPSGVDPGTLVKSYGYDYIVAGENLILGNFSSEKEVVTDWMNSPGHRANILNVRYTEMGAAIVEGTYKGSDAWIGVQEFGLPLSACAQPDTSLENQINTNKAQLDSLSQQIDQKKKQLDATNNSDPTYNQMVQDYNALVNQYNALAQTTKGEISTYNTEVNAFNTCVNGT